MRKTYRFGHSVRQGGYVYGHKSVSDIINKAELKDALLNLSNEHGLIDVTIKVYDSIFFMFFTTKPSIAPLTIIQQIQKAIEAFAEWPNDYIFSGVYDLQEQYVREDLKKWGFDYDKG